MFLKISFTGMMPMICSFLTYLTFESLKRWQLNTTIEGTSMIIAVHIFTFARGFLSSKPHSLKVQVTVFFCKTHHGRILDFGKEWVERIWVNVN